MPMTRLCQPIEVILADVDGVLTDGSIIFNNEGVEIKRFHIRDGLGIKLWQQAGGKFGLITGRNSHIVNVRAAELGIEIVRQGTEKKLAAVKEILSMLNLKPEQACYIGDDLPDLPALQYVGLGAATADACVDVRQAADFVTTVPGGHGAVRELIELILRAQQRWDDAVHAFQL
jgi:3-deoxy-D-manno-octulosonate 8-phosphate phosphatase (KDO 8-P phosphatase)